MKKIFLAFLAILFILSGRAYPGIGEAETFYKEGKLDEAFSEYKKILPDLKPIQAYSYMTRVAGAYVKQNNFQKAEEIYRTVLGIEGLTSSQKGTAQFLVGHYLYSQKKYEEAIAEYKKLDDIKEMPQSQRADAQRHIGHCYRLLGRTEEALAEYRKTFEIKGAHPPHLANTQFVIASITKKEDDYVKVFEMAGAQIGDLRAVYRVVKDKIRLVPGYVMQLKTNSAKEDLVKLGAQDAILAREALRQLPGDEMVVSGLLSAARIEDMPDREEASLLVDIWQAHAEKSDSGPGSIKIVEDVSGRLNALLGKVSSVQEARKKIESMK